MGMPRKGWSVSKSKSPETIADGLCSAAISSATRRRCCCDRYLSNLVRNRTASSSDFVDSENNKLKSARALMSARAEVPCGFSMALTSVLVSKINSKESYLIRKSSKRLLSKCDNVLIVSASTPSSANSIASSILSPPEGYSLPLSKASKARSATSFCAAGGNFFQTADVGSANAIVMVKLYKLKVQKA